MTKKKCIDHYVIQKQLGKKAGRKTFLAKDLETQELVVIKLLSFSNGFEWQDLKLFEREAQTLQNLEHPSIPRYLNYFEVKSENFTGFALVQSYIEAQTLEEYVKSGVIFTESEVKQIAFELLNILNYLHSLSPPVIHRDIKPSNILLSDRSGNNIGKIYLIDFGSVQTAVARESQTMTVVGTYGYMAQEQFGDRAVPASDIYSLGATLIYLLTATHPADLPQQDFRIKFEYLTNLSPVFNDWLRLMIEPSLDKRFDSAKNAIEVLEKPNKKINKKPHLQTKPAKHDFLVTCKPKSSKIQFTKNPNYLEFYIPPTRLKSADIKMFGCGFFIVLTSVFSFIIAITTILMTATSSLLAVLTSIFSIFAFFISISLISISYSYFISGF
ncbi:MAG: serine/threonine-protein kinase, partial [Cyanobacteriota bacterium]|nr:serine/threonine-protein kinase [Cyanobacteriota bacterium]